MYIDYTSFPLWFFRSETFFKLRRRRIVSVSEPRLRDVNESHVRIVMHYYLYSAIKINVFKSIYSFLSFREKVSIDKDFRFPFLKRRYGPMDGRVFFSQSIDTSDRVMRWINNYLIKRFYIFFLSPLIFSSFLKKVAIVLKFSNAIPKYTYRNTKVNVLKLHIYYYTTYNNWMESFERILFRRINIDEKSNGRK